MSYDPWRGKEDPAVAAPALRFDLTCPRCGSDVELVARGTPGLKMTQAVVRCTGSDGCSSNPWVVRVTLEPFNRGSMAVNGKGAA